MKCASGWFLAAVTFAALPNAFADGLFDDPITLFEDALLPVLTHSEWAKVQTTSRGFFARADRQSGMHDEYEPTESGIYLDVAVRDSIEVPEFKDSSETVEGITERSVSFPAMAGTQGQGLRVTLKWGKGANPEALRAIEKCIAEIRQAVEKAGPPK